MEKMVAEFAQNLMDVTKTTISLAAYGMGQLCGGHGPDAKIVADRVTEPVLKTAATTAAYGAGTVSSGNGPMAAVAANHLLDRPTR